MPADKCRMGVGVRMYLMYAILRLYKAHAKLPQATKNNKTELS